MAVLKYSGEEIRKRQFDSWSDGGGGARWAFFGIFLVLVFFVVIGTLRVNKKRAQQGSQPLYGTRWLTPPSYRQSQTQYNQPDHVRDPDLPGTYVPTYTETANEYDMGFYDNRGAFHPNPNAKAVDMAPPTQVHHRDPSLGERGPATDLDHNLNEDDENEDFDDLYRRPSHFQSRNPGSRQPSTTATTNIDPSTVGPPAEAPPSTTTIPGAFPTTSSSTPSTPDSTPTPVVQQIATPNINFATRRF